jgi:hypothetical protein
MKINQSVSNIWWKLPPFVEFLREYRNDNIKLAESFNISIILHSATIIEGFISQFMNDNLILPDRSLTLKGRLEKEFVDRIEKSSWNELQKLYNLMFGKELSTEVENEIWKGVTSLFAFRNLLVHSSPIVVSLYEGNETEETIISGKYKNIYNFLAIEKQIISKIVTENSSPIMNLITAQSADYYWRNTKIFLENILSNQKIQSNLTEIMFKRAFKIKE